MLQQFNFLINLQFDELEFNSHRNQAVFEHHSELNITKFLVTNGRKAILTLFKIGYYHKQVDKLDARGNIYSLVGYQIIKVKISSESGTKEQRFLRACRLSTC